MITTAFSSTANLTISASNPSLVRKLAPASRQTARRFHILDASCADNHIRRVPNKVGDHLVRFGHGQRDLDDGNPASGTASAAKRASSVEETRTRRNDSNFLDPASYILLVHEYGLLWRSGSKLHAGFPFKRTSDVAMADLSAPPLLEAAREPASTRPSACR